MHELKILNELRKLSAQKHIVTHQATWTQDGRYCILFPYAKCNLRQYMKWRAFGPSTQDNISWFLQQLRGLAQALKDIHNLPFLEAFPSGSGGKAGSLESRQTGWHHDLKPENILYFSDPGPENGIFKVADFGSGKINTYHSGSMHSNTPNGTLTYEPPEAQSEGATSRPYDLWSLGCIFLELLTWAVYDFQSVEQFASNRVDRRFPDSHVNMIFDDGFWQMTRDGQVIIRNSVSTWIQDLRCRIRQQPLTEVLELVICMLDPDRLKRITAQDLWDQLDRIYKRQRLDLEKILDHSQGTAPSLPDISTEFLDDCSHNSIDDGFSYGEYSSINPRDTAGP